MTVADRVLGLRRYDDAVLGALVRPWWSGRWRGAIRLGAAHDGAAEPERIPLVLPGGRSGPDEGALALARDFLSRYERLRPTIAEALFEHYQPYAESVATGEEAASPGLPSITRPDQVWPHVARAWVLISRQGGSPTVEVAYRAAWDEEHTLGARFQAWTLVELNGSVCL